MKSHWFLVVALMISMYPMDVYSFSRNGTDLFQACNEAFRLFAKDPTQTKDDIAKGAYCLGQIEAMGDILHTMGLMCPPKDSTTRELLYPVIEFLKNTDELDELAGILITEALREKYPCGKPSSYFEEQCKNYCDDYCIERLEDNHSYEDYNTQYDPR